MSESTAEAKAAYEKAVHLGKKEGGCPAVLDDILKERHITAPSEIPLGRVSIPLDRVAGTRNRDRSSSFSRSFYPTLKSGTEFADKWTALCRAHLEEGIREPVKAYEFMNLFYIEEGNKRVSVLKYFDAVSVPANVIRILPPYTDDRETRIYYEFLDFYSLSGINYIWFSRTGSFARLQRLVGKRPNELWDDDEKLNFSSAYSRFQMEYAAFTRSSGRRLSLQPGDVFLYFMDLYGYSALQTASPVWFRQKLKKLEEELILLQSDQSVALHLDPEEPARPKNPLLGLLPAGAKKLRTGFIHAGNPDVSGWIYSHELGRFHLEHAFPDQVSTTCYCGGSPENAARLLEQAVADGNKLIFTTSPVLLKESLKAALEYPQLKILNCSLNTSHKHIRTYYARIHEAKFLMGAIAGAMAENGRLGYIADYPIYGAIAGINAFARGAQMVNPRARVHLAWSKTARPLDRNFFEEQRICVICGRDVAQPGSDDREFGLFLRERGEVWNLAVPVWNWGKFYERMIRKVMNGSWKTDDDVPDKGVNYWWGMSSGVIDVFCSHRLPMGTARLIELLKETISRGDFNPFSGVMYSQTGVVREHSSDSLTPEEIVTMDWLADNVIGSIPARGDLVEPAQSLAIVQGVREEDHLP